MSDVRTAAFRRIREVSGELRQATDEAGWNGEVMADWVGERATEIDAVAATYASSQESVEEKGRRLLVEGRLTVTTAGADGRASVVAECKGDSGEVYALGYDAATAEWRCTCPKRGRNTRCSHLVALQLVTVRPETHGS
jgi:uncharacterized Zn finger protein